MIAISLCNTGAKMPTNRKTMKTISMRALKKRRKRKEKKSSFISLPHVMLIMLIIVYFRIVYNSLFQNYIIYKYSVAG